MQSRFNCACFKGKTLVNYLLMGLVLGACFVDSPPFINASRADGLNEGHFVSINKNPCGASSIIILLHLGRPTAIFGAVHAVDIQSVKSASIGALPHIFGEGFKTVLPPFANLNASTTVIVEAYIVGIAAPKLHALPTCIGLPPFKSSGSSMHFSPKTPTAFAHPSLHIGKKFLALFSTVTKAFNKGGPFSQSKHKEISVFFTNAVSASKMPRGLIHNNDHNMLTCFSKCKL